MQGDGMKSKLYDGMIDHIIKSTMTPYLRAGEYGKAIEAAVIEIGLVCEGRAPNSFRTSSSSSNRGEGFEDVGNYIAVVCVVLFGGFAAYRAYQQQREDRELEQGRRRLDELMREVQREESSSSSSLGEGGGGGGEGGDFMSRSCPICLEDFPPLDVTGPRRPMALQCK
jgi:uncharacterized membrane protein YgcG